MPTHADYREPGVVSLFLGDFASEAKLERYLTKDFAGDFGFTIDSSDGPEMACSREPLPIRKLLEGFSWESRFAGAAAKLAGERGWEAARCAVVFYNFRYLPTGSARTRLHFVGTVIFP